MSIRLRLVHEANAFLPTRANPGILTDRSDEQLAKAMASMRLTLMGIEKLNRLVQLRKAPHPISQTKTSMTTLCTASFCFFHGAMFSLRSKSGMATDCFLGTAL